MLRRLAPILISAALLALPAGTAFAASPFGVGASWISQLFGWHVPVIGHVSSLFDSRRDNVESNSAERNILLIRRRDGQNASVASSSAAYVTASTSPTTLPYGLFEKKKSDVIAGLGFIMNGLQKTRNDLGNIIDHSSVDGTDMSAAKAALAKADSDMQAAQDAVAGVAAYEPSSDEASSTVDLAPAETGLDAAIAAIQIERTDLEATIKLAGNSLKSPAQPDSQ